MGVTTASISCIQSLSKLSTLTDEAVEQIEQIDPKNDDVAERLDLDASNNALQIIIRMRNSRNMDMVKISNFRRHR